MSSIGMYELAPLLLNLFFMLGGAGLEPGVPPAEIPPALLNIAPEDCVMYYCSGGLVAPKPNSENRTEQLLAEPEITRFAAAIKQFLHQSVAEETPDPEMARLAASLFETLSQRPLALFIEDVRIDPESPPVIKAGMVIDLGDQADAYQKQLETFLEENAPPEALKKVEIAGLEWTAVQVPDMPMIAFVFRGKYLIAGIDQEAIEGMIKRIKSPPPAWLTDAIEQIDMDRVGTLAYINLERVLATVPQDVEGVELGRIMETLGLSGLTRLYCATGLDDDGFMVQSRLGIEGPPSGLFAFLDVEPLSADDVADIPADATFAGVVRFDVDKVFDAVKNMVDEISEESGDQVDNGLNAIQATIGINLKQDVLQALGDRACIYSSPGEGGLLVGTTLVVEVKDREKLVGVQDRLLLMARAAMSPNDPYSPKIDTYEFNGHVIYTFDVPDDDFLVTPSWCITDDALLFALYPQSIKAYLSRGEDFQSLSECPEVAAALAEGQRTLALWYVDSRSIFETVYTFVPPMVKVMRLELGREMDMELPPLAAFPSAGCISKHLKPSITIVRRCDEGLEAISRQTTPSVNPVLMTPILIGLTMPAVSSAQGAARRAQSMNNMRQLGVAMLMYQMDKETYPPAYIADEDGKPLLSWRVAILPYIDEEALYEQFHLDEPWDSPHNIKLLDQIPVILRSPQDATADPGKTPYVVVAGKGTMFEKDKKITPADIRDGMSQTAMLLEVGSPSAVPWTAPEDFTPDEDKPLLGLTAPPDGNLLVGFADCSVQTIPLYQIDLDLLKAFFTIAGKEVTDPDGMEIPGMYPDEEEEEYLPDDAMPEEEMEEEEMKEEPMPDFEEEESEEMEEDTAPPAPALR